MMTGQKVSIPRNGGPQDGFWYWWVQINLILNAKPVWHVVQADDASSTSSSPQVWVKDSGSGVASDPEYAKDVSCSLILQWLGEVPFRASCVMQYQEDPQERGKFLHDQFSAMTISSRVPVHTTFAWMEYSGQPMHKWVAECELPSARLMSMEAAMDENELGNLCAESFGVRSKSSYGGVLLVLLKKTT